MRGLNALNRAVLVKVLSCLNKFSDALCFNVGPDEACSPAPRPLLSTKPMPTSWCERWVAANLVDGGLTLGLCAVLV